MGTQLIPYNSANVVIFGHQTRTYIVGDGLLHFGDGINSPDTPAIPYNGATILFGKPVFASNTGNGIEISWDDDLISDVMAIAPLGANNLEQAGVTQSFLDKVVASDSPIVASLKPFPDIRSGTLIKQAAKIPILAITAIAAFIILLIFLFRRR